MFPLLRSIEKLPRPLVISHRGIHSQPSCPENTIPAFRNALEQGADGIELDIQLTRDDEIIVFHDYQLKRLMGISGRLNQFSLKELQSLKFCSGKSDSQTRIPTLQSVFREFGATLYYNLEIKRSTDSYGLLIDILLQLISRNQLLERVWVSSFDFRFVREWYNSNTNIPAALLFEWWNIFSKRNCKRPEAAFMHPRVRLLKKIDRFAHLQKPICFWDVNRETDFEVITQPPVFAVITDNVRLARSMIPRQV